MKTRIIKSPNIAVIVGPITDNQLHQHYAVQLTLALSKPFEVTTESESYFSKALACKPMIKHQLMCEQSVLVLLINPASSLGHFLSQHLFKSELSTIPSVLTEPLTTLARQWQHQSLSDRKFLYALKQLFSHAIKECVIKQHQSDQRITQALAYIEQYNDRVIPLTELAAHCSLSESRFLHLFKQVTGVSYRRMQLWLRLTASFDLLDTPRSMTELAHLSGFSDSAHYSRTFKECFGYSPSVVFKHSEFELV